MGLLFFYRWEEMSFKENNLDSMRIWVWELCT